MVVLGSRLALLAALPAIVAGAPADEKAAHRVSLKQVAGRKPVSNAHQYMEALEKHGAEIPSSLRDRAAEDVSGSAVLTAEEGDHWDAAFVVPVQVGSETLNMKFDTGSSYVWVYSTDLPESQIGEHTPYDTSDGTKLNQTFSIKFGGDDGSVTGNVYEDTVTLGDSITSSSQAIEAAQNINASFLTDRGYDGVLGLSPGSMYNTKPPHPTFFHNIRPTLEQPLYATALKHNEPGTLDIGFIDDSKFTGSLHTIPAGGAKAHWVFAVSVNGTSMRGRIDTGTPLILVHEDVAKNYYAQVPGSWHDEYGLTYEVPCDATLPDLEVSIFGGYNTSVPGEYLNIGDRGWPRGLCFGALQWDQGATQSAFGTTFLKGQYVTFDLEEGKLGFAPLA